mgnify:CR=1 FL=1
MRETFGAKSFKVVTLVVLTLLTVVPLYVMITTAIKPLGDVQNDFTWIPTNITFQPFIDMWSPVPLGQYFVNSPVGCTVATLFRDVWAWVNQLLTLRLVGFWRGAYVTQFIDNRPQADSSVSWGGGDA